MLNLIAAIACFASVTFAVAIGEINLLTILNAMLFGANAIIFAYHYAHLKSHSDSSHGTFQ